MTLKEENRLRDEKTKRYKSQKVGGKVRRRAKISLTLPLTFATPFPPLLTAVLHLFVLHVPFAGESSLFVEGLGLALPRSFSF